MVIHGAQITDADPHPIAELCYKRLCVGKHLAVDGQNIEFAALIGIGDQDEDLISAGPEEAWP